MNAVNVPLLRKMVEWVEAEEQRSENREWDQTVWFDLRTNQAWCGTVACIAGKIALMEGWKPVNVIKGGLVAKGGEQMLASRVAARALGITYSDIWQLFAEDLTAAEIRAAAEEIAGERL